MGDKEVPKSRLDMLRQQLQKYTRDQAMSSFSWEKNHSDKDSPMQVDSCILFPHSLKGFSPVKRKQAFSEEDLEFFDALGISVE